MRASSFSLELAVGGRRAGGGGGDDDGGADIEAHGNGIRNSKARGVSSRDACGSRYSTSMYNTFFFPAGSIELRV